VDRNFKKGATEMTETAHQRNERMMALWTRILGVFTIILAIVSALTAVILNKTDQTSRLRDRAFVYFGDPPLTPYPPNDPIVWGVGITVANAGNMPARRVTIRYACPDVASSAGNVDAFSVAKWESAKIGSVLGPKQGVTLQGCNVPIDTINAAKKSLRQVFYVVEADYIDGFDLDTIRVTQMSRFFGFDQWGGQSLQFTDTHNCSDGDCPK
jgi:hypothetical protein